MAHRHRHVMPFGAELIDGGGVCFRFWAPGVAAAALCIDAAAERPMAAVGGGWFELIVPTAQAGSRYRFRLPDGLQVPDPASRRNPDDVHGPSEVIDPDAFAWPDDPWCGRPWGEAVIYELHVGAFTPGGDFVGIEARLDYLVELGITALEIMPVADFPGRRNWGYDGVLHFAPAARYGTPDDFKRLIAAAHARGLMVLLDVVYNHFGPEGNYLHCYCSSFFNPAHHTPWGAAINFDGPDNRTVRDFFIHNALYWIEEFQLDGLRLDAIHAIRDDSTPDIVEEIRAALRNGPGRSRHVHLILENDRNEAHYLESRPWPDGNTAGGIAQWNDDIHHAFHVIATGESDGYYIDYAADPLRQLARCLVEGFAYQGDPSPFRGGELRGEPSGYLPPTAFINFLQTHDQVGNRALGERLCHLAAPAPLAALTGVLLLAPQIPMIFMGEEFAAAQPFLFFCDFGENPELAQAITAGRRREFAGYAKFADPAVRARIPDPNAAATFQASQLDWAALARPPHQRMHALYKQLLALRQAEIVPRLAGMGAIGAAARLAHLGPHVLRVQWALGDGSQLELLANLGPAAATGIAPATGRRLFAMPADMLSATDCLPPWSVVWHLLEKTSP